MNKVFFQLSDHTMKVRRNLLFVSVLIVLHIKVEPLSNLQLFSIKVPDSIIEFALFVSVGWFFLNYSYYFFIEMLDWRKSQVKIPAFLSGSYPVRTTLIPFFEAIGEGRYKFGVTFAAELSKPSSEDAVDTFDAKLEEASRKVKQHIEQTIRSDLDRINEFSRAMARHSRFHRFRFWLLDVLVPLFASLYGVFLLSW